MSCVLKLNLLEFDQINFKRLGSQNEKELEFSFSVSLGTNLKNPEIKKVSVGVTGDKADEYHFEIVASGYFSYEGDVGDDIIRQNAVAIVMPYVRSEVSILTAQPGIDPVVLPPFNIIEMLGENSKNII